MFIALRSSSTRITILTPSTDPAFNIPRKRQEATEAHASTGSFPLQNDPIDKIFN